MPAMEERQKRIARVAVLGLLLGAAAACEDPKTPANADGGTAHEGIDRSSSGDKAHCGGDGK